MLEGEQESVVLVPGKPETSTKVASDIDSGLSRVGGLSEKECGSLCLVFGRVDRDTAHGGGL